MSAKKLLTSVVKGAQGKTSKNAGAKNTGAAKPQGAQGKAPAAVDVAPQNDGAKLYVKSHVGGIEFSERRPGVISAMVEMLLVAPDRAPSKAQMLARLVEKFPDRAPEKMKSTLNMQVPSGLFIEKRIVVKTIEREDGARGYHVDRAATALAQAKWRAEKEAKRAQGAAK